MLSTLMPNWKYNAYKAIEQNSMLIQVTGDEIWKEIKQIKTSLSRLQS